MAERFEGKWASEAYDFIRLFGQFGRSLYGLLLLELVWSGYVLLVSRIQGPGGAGILRMPAWSWLPPVAADTLLVVGAIVILLFWVAFSGFYRYFLWPLRHILLGAPYLALALSFLSLVPLVVASFAWAVIDVPLRQRRRRRRIGRPGLWIVREASCIAAALSRPIADGIAALLASAASIGRVGIVPPTGFTYGEDLQALKANVQVFASAGSAFPREVRPWLRVVLLPDLWRPRSPGVARFMARLFSIDILLWGSFLAEGLLWLNVCRHHAPAAGGESTRQSSLRDDETEWNVRGDDGDLFPDKGHELGEAMIASSTDAHEGYLAVLLAILDLLQARHRLGEMLSRRHLARERRYYLALRTWDRLKDAIAVARGEIETALFSAVVRCGEGGAAGQPAGAPPRVTQPVARAASARIGSLLHEWSDRMLTKPQARLLAEVLERCVRIVPEDRIHRYRLAALLLFVDDDRGRERALSLIEEAAGVAGQWTTQHVYAAIIRARWDLKDAWEEYGEKRDLALARYVARVAQALHHGDDEHAALARKELQQEIERWHEKDTRHSSLDVARFVFAAAADRGAGRPTETFEHMLVARRAERLWTLAGRPAGRDGEFWSRAEVDIRGNGSGRSGGGSPSGATAP